MNNDFIDQKIDDFWEWFLLMEQRFLDFFEDRAPGNKEALIEHLNNKVLDFGLFSWEMGPGKTKKYYFTVSPNGNEQRMRISQQLMQSAPNLPDWELNYYKPPKENELTLSLYDDFLIKRDIDASGWQFFVSRPSKNGIEILLQADSISALDVETKQSAADTIVQNCIGEKNKILYLDQIRFINEFDAQHREGRPIQELRRAFESLVRIN